MKDDNVKGIENVIELLGAVRALKFALLNGACTRQQAKNRSKILIEKINITVTKIAKKHGIKPKLLSFENIKI